MSEKQTGIQLIEAERRRQIEKENWTSEHDDEHKNGDLRDAAEAYLLQLRRRGHWSEKNMPEMWPWDRRFWKPSADPIRQLVKAGALIAAEIDRLQRNNPMTIDQLNKQSMTTADILKANEWEFCPSIDRGGVAQPEYWTHPDHNGPFTEEEAFRQHESDKLHSGLDGLINQWAETNNTLQRELSAVCEERDALSNHLGALSMHIDAYFKGDHSAKDRILAYLDQVRPSTP